MQIPWKKKPPENLNKGELVMDQATFDFGIFNGFGEKDDVYCQISNVMNFLYADVFFLEVGTFRVDIVHESELKKGDFFMVHQVEDCSRCVDPWVQRWTCAEEIGIFDSYTYLTSKYHKPEDNLPHSPERSLELKFYPFRHSEKVCGGHKITHVRKRRQTVHLFFTEDDSWKRSVKYVFSKITLLGG